MSSLLIKFWAFMCHFIYFFQSQYWTLLILTPHYRTKYIHNVVVPLHQKGDIIVMKSWQIFNTMLGTSVNNKDTNSFWKAILCLFRYKDYIMCPRSWPLTVQRIWQNLHKHCDISQDLRFFNMLFSFIPIFTFLPIW